MNKIIPFVIASNEKYIRHAITLTVSILQNSSKDLIYKLLFFQKNCEQKSLNIFQSIKKYYENFDIEIYSNNFIDNLTDYGRYSMSAFDRLYIPNILNTYSKVLYLDCDMIVLDDISKLYNEDISDYYAAVCKDYGLEQLVSEKSQKYLDRNYIYKDLNWYDYAKNILNLKDVYNMFNSGMMLMNLTKFREDNIGEKCIKDLIKYQYVIVDQDALNKHLQGKVKYVDNRWNLSVGTLTFNDKIKHKLYNAAKNPAILHYKPWANNKLLFTDEYYKYFLKSPLSPFKNKTKHVIDGVVKKDMCIGCGICANVCPHNCLDIKLNKNKEYAPVFNENKCTNCSICLQYCPHSEMNIIKQLDEVKSNPKYYGTENANYYVAWDNNDNNRIKSASGGIVTQIAKYMLANNYVSGIIHGEMVENDRKGIHYRAAISRTLEEIDERRSSFYFAFTFDNILKEIKDREEAYLFIGVPCIIRGVKNLFEKNKSYKKIKLYTICLSCSHNVSGLFTDYLADSLNINKRQKYTVNLRDKDKNMVDANNYMNTYKGINFFISQNRFKTIFTDTWRNYYFAMNICNYCSDFWGAHGDVSVKDAWGKWANEDRLNKSIVISRKDLINKIIENSSEINYEILQVEDVINPQMITIIYKQIEAENKLYKKLFAKENIKNGLLKNIIILKLSKFFYRILGFKISYGIMRLINKAVSIYAKQ